MGNASVHFWMICISLRILNELWTRLGEELWHHAKIRLHHGKTAVWNLGGEVFPDIGSLERASTRGPFSESVERGHPQHSSRKWHLDSWPSGHTRVLCCVNSKSKLQNTKRCWRESLTSRTFNAPGWSCCSAQRRGRISSSGRSAPPCPMHSQPNMMRRSGVVFAHWWVWIQVPSCVPPNLPLAMGGHGLRSAVKLRHASPLGELGRCHQGTLRLLEPSSVLSTRILKPQACKPS